MSTKVTMPQLGESVTEGTISKWLVKVGDQVKKYDALCEVMTDKVNAEVPSSYSGTILEIVAQEDETIEVGGVICVIQEEGTESADPAGAGKGASASGEASKAGSAAVSAAENVADGSGGEQQGMRGRYSPAVLKLSQEHQIDLSRVQGTGKGGRITRKDLMQLIESGNIPIAGQVEQAETSGGASPFVSSSPASDPAESPRSSSAPVSQATVQKPLDLPVAAGDIEIPVTGVRRAIASKMLQSKHEAPHAWTMVEVDVTNLVSYRNKMKAEFKQKEGINLTFLPFFIKAAVEALKEFPIINSQWAGDKIIQKKEINISIAVATEDALYVPVIKRADEKSILGLARSIDELAHKTRTGKLSSDDMQGGTFTVNNTGSFGSVQSTPIINYPQAAILSVEAIVKRPVVVDNMIGIRDMMNLCLSLDHRVLDGLVCGRFLQSIKQKLEAMGEGTDLY